MCSAAPVGRVLCHVPWRILEPMTVFTFSCVVKVVFKENYWRIPLIDTRTSEMIKSFQFSWYIHWAFTAGCACAVCWPSWVVLLSQASRFGGERCICRWLRGMLEAQTMLCLSGWVMGGGIVNHPSAPLDEGLSTLWSRTQMGRCDNYIAKRQPSLVFSLSCCLSSYSAQWMQDPTFQRKREYPWVWEKTNVI